MISIDIYDTSCTATFYDEEISIFAYFVNGIRHEFDDSMNMYIWAFRLLKIPDRVWKTNALNVAC